MGMTFDVGEENIEAVHEVFDAASHEDPLFCGAYDWCYKHDHNTLVDICTMCNPKASADDFRKAAIEWIEREGE